MQLDRMTPGNPHDPKRFAALLEPGQRVRHPDRPDWGDGQVQSVDGARVTVNFAHAGKVLINARVVSLQVIDG
jgi:FKBP-type peptidyl-prolyl cis-trans isomerase 2